MKWFASVVLVVVVAVAAVRADCYGANTTTFDGCSGYAQAGYHCNGAMCAIDKCVGDCDSCAVHYPGMFFFPLHALFVHCWLYAAPNSMVWGLSVRKHRRDDGCGSRSLLSCDRPGWLMSGTPERHLPVPQSAVWNTRQEEKRKKKRKEKKRKMIVQCTRKKENKIWVNRLLC
jgi:hypothetical protein